MREIDLQEHVESKPVRLSVDEWDALSKVRPSITLTPVRGEGDMYCLKPGAVVGAVQLDGLSVVIRPKLEISRVLYLVSYAMGELKLQSEEFDFPEEPELVEVLARLLTSAARRAFARGLLYGYRVKHEALHTVRGRIDNAEQLRRRFDIALPVQTRYDDFTDDILANRLVKAAVELLGRMRLRCPRSREGLRWAGAALGNVSLVRFPSGEIPEVAFDRLNAHYREVVALSRLILQHQTFELGWGNRRAAGWLIDMNKVFQGFITQALREALSVSERVFRSDHALPQRVYLDESETIRLKPDMTWWDGTDCCVFAGDVKYKSIRHKNVPNADLYQMLAYATALNLPGGLLVYAEGEAEPAVHQVRHSGKRLEIATVDLSGSIHELDAAIRSLAQRVRSLSATPATLTV